MPAPSSERRAGRPAALDWLAGAAGLLGSALLLSARTRHRPARLALEPGDVAFDDSALAGRGRPRAPPSLEAERRGHEPQDADPRAIAISFATLGVTAIVLVFVLFGVLRLFHAQLAASRPLYTHEQSAQIEPPKPQLEAHPETDLHRELASQRRALEGYGWTDAAHTTAHVPIDRAMALVVGRSLDAAP